VADHWFEAVAEHLGSAYLRYSFTYGTEQEVDFLVGELGLEPGDRVLDVGCGPGRHARALARRGIETVGVDVSATFVELARTDAPPGCSFVRADARDLPALAGRDARFAGGFDAAVSLCQGAFGLPDPTAGVLAAEPDAAVLAGMAAAVRPGGRVALSAFSAYFQLRYLDDANTFDAATGVHHERTVVKSPDGVDREVDLWTSCWTPRELRLLARSVGLEPEAVWGVSPGAYARNPPGTEHHEYLLVAHRSDG
jgi:SAM-dependent methyltransferase